MNVNEFNFLINVLNTENDVLYLFEIAFIHKIYLFFFLNIIYIYIYIKEISYIQI